MLTIYPSNTKGFPQHNGIGAITPTKAAVKEELNGQFELELDHPLAGKWEHLIEGNIIKCMTPRGLQLFRIYKTVKDMKQAIKVYARHIFYDLYDNYIENAELTGDAQEALDTMFNSLQYETDFSVSSNIANEGELTIEKRNPIDALINSFIPVWGGEVERDNYEINLLASLGEDKGFTIRYGKNLTGLNVNIDMSNIATRVFPTGLDEDGTIIELPEKYIDSPLISSYPHPKIQYIHYPEIKVGQGYWDPEAVQAELRAKVAEMYEFGADKPLINVKVSFVDLTKTEQYKDYAILQTVALGDTVTVLYEPYDINVKARVISYVYDVLNERYIDMEIGNFKGNLATTINNISNRVESISTPSGDVKASKIQGIIDMYKAQLKVMADSAEKQVPRAMLFEDKDPHSPTYGAIAVGTQGLLIADEYKDNEWQWRTAITGKGIAADQVLTGKLLADLIKVGVLSSENGDTWINMEDGTFSFAGGKIAFNGETFEIRLGSNETVEEYVEDEIEKTVDGITSPTYETYPLPLEEIPLDGVGEFKIQGNTVYAEPINGNFANTSGWTSQNSTIHVNNNILSVTANNSYGGVYQNLNYKSGDTLWLRLSIKCNTQIYVYLMENTATRVITFTGTGNWETKYVKVQISDVTTPQIIIQDPASSGWQEFQIKKVTLVNLTTNNLTLKTDDEINLLIPNWFEGFGSVSGKVLSRGKNLFDGELELGRYNYTTGNTLSTDSRDGIRASNKIPIKQNTTYVCSGFPHTRDYGTFNVLELDGNNTIVALNQILTSGSQSFTTSANAKNIIWYQGKTGVGYSNYDYDIQIEEGDTATTYEEYKESVLDIPELRGLPNGVRDEAKDGKFIQRISDEYTIKVTDISSLNRDLTNVDQVSVVLPPDFVKSRGMGKFKSELREVDRNDRDNINSIGALSNFEDGKLRYIIEKGTTLEQAKQQLAGKKLFYELATPIITDLSTNVYKNGSVEFIPDTIMPDKAEIKIPTSLGAVANQKVTQTEVNAALNTAKDYTDSEIEILANDIDIMLEGKVGFSDLSTPGKTTIAGDNITTGKINAQRIDTKDLSAEKIIDPNDSRNYIVIDKDGNNIGFVAYDGVYENPYFVVRNNGQRAPYNATYVEIGKQSIYNSSELIVPRYFNLIAKDYLNGTERDILTVDPTGIYFAGLSVEEGTWTPSISGLSMYNYFSTYYGRYMKIGNYVYIWLYLKRNSNSLYGEWYKISLPFPPAADHIPSLLDVKFNEYNYTTHNPRAHFAKIGAQDGYMYLYRHDDRFSTYISPYEAFENMEIFISGGYYI